MSAAPAPTALSAPFVPPKEAVKIPDGFTRAQIDALVALNPTAWFVLPLEPGEQEVKSGSGATFAGILKWVGPLVAAGVGILVPGSLGAFVAGALKVGIPNLTARLEGQPGKVWTIAEMVAERDNLPERKT